MSAEGVRRSFFVESLRQKNREKHKFSAFVFLICRYARAFFRVIAGR